MPRPVVKAPSAPAPAKPRVAWEVEEIVPDPVVMELQHRAVVKDAPSRYASRLGFIVGGTRVTVRDTYDGSGCNEKWLKIDPYGWVCARASETAQAPSTEVLPKLGKRRVPGTYGKVRKGARIYTSKSDIGTGGGRASADDMVSLKKTVRIGGRSYWFTADREYVASRDIRRFRGSGWEGVVLGDETGMQLPVAFAFDRETYGQGSVEVRSHDHVAAPVVRKLNRREAVSVLETSKDGRYLRIGENEWIARVDVRLAQKSRMPTQDVIDEAWLDVDLDNQVVVLYKGDTPIYATLTSTGRRKHRTPTGIYRVERKKGTTTMRSAPNEEEQYVVEKVPWTAYFHYGYAIHGAYWHDQFGQVKSHGCVNLSPADAQHIYSHLGPEAPPGWNEVVASEERPGGLVRVRNRRNPTPAFRGYAAQVESMFQRTQRLAQRERGSAGRTERLSQ